ncbi:MAG: ADP-ribosylglycohydrolase family protein [Planctomycetes bacterium]|nr:ADP-ribosylglycohydrolase family protein [Planctomycetota bacterium]
MNIEDTFNALAFGEALGISSEKASLEQVKFIYKMNLANDWPFACIGGGPRGMRAYLPSVTCKMAANLVNTYRDNYSILYDDDLEKLIGVGDQNNSDTSNTALARNAVTAGMGSYKEAIFDSAFTHTVLSHQAPIVILCSAAQTWLLHNSEHLDDQDVDWRRLFQRDFEFWLAATDYCLAIDWQDEFGAQLDDAWKLFDAADFGKHSFRPFDEFDVPDNDCLFTLQIGVWALRWSSDDEPYPEEYLPDDFPREPFKRIGKDVIGWVAMLGRDAPAYCAVAGPLIAIYKYLDEEQLKFVLGRDLIYSTEQIFNHENAFHKLNPSWLGLAEIEYKRLRNQGENHDAFAIEADNHHVVFIENYQWRGSHELVFAPRVWGINREHDPEWLASSLAEAVEQRKLARFTCKYCNELCEPWNGDGDSSTVCHGCMTRHFGVVF